jgi:MATE family multidrug resistance protein
VVAKLAPLLAVNRDIFIRSLALQSVFFLITVQGARLGDATVAANALLLNGLLLTAHALDGLAHAVEALCAGMPSALATVMPCAARWWWPAVGRCWRAWVSPCCSCLPGTCSSRCRPTLPACAIPRSSICPTSPRCHLIAVWSYLLDGLFIGATRAREMRNGMLLTVALLVPFGWALQGFGNHGLWITFLLFMLLRSLTLGVIAWRLRRNDGWFARAH